MLKHFDHGDFSAENLRRVRVIQEMHITNTLTMEDAFKDYVDISFIPTPSNTVDAEPEHWVVCIQWPGAVFYGDLSTKEEAKKQAEELVDKIRRGDVVTHMRPVMPSRVRAEAEIPQPASGEELQPQTDGEAGTPN